MQKMQILTSCLETLQQPLAKALIQGQWISVLIAGTGIFATILSDTTPSSNFPTFLNCCNYILLSTFLCRKKNAAGIVSSKCKFTEIFIKFAIYSFIITYILLV